MLVLGKGRLRFLRYQAIGRFQRHSASHICGIVTGLRFTQGIQRSDLGDDVKGGADGELQVDVRKRFESRAELRARTPYRLATAPSLPRRRLSMVMNRCTLPSLCLRRTIASSRQIGTSILSVTCPSFLRLGRVGKGSRKLLLVSPKALARLHTVPSMNVCRPNIPAALAHGHLKIDCRSMWGS